MGMTIDEAMNNLSGILTEATEDEDSVCYVTGNDAETLQVAIDTMRKYQKIAELYDYWRSDKCEYTISCMENIGKVLRDGNVD